MPNIRYMPKWLAFLIPITLSFALLGALGCSSDDAKPAPPPIVYNQETGIANITISQGELMPAYNDDVRNYGVSTFYAPTSSLAVAVTLKDPKSRLFIGGQERNNGQVTPVTLNSSGDTTIPISVQAEDGNNFNVVTLTTKQMRPNTTVYVYDSIGGNLLDGDVRLSLRDAYTGELLASDIAFPVEAQGTVFLGLDKTRRYNIYARRADTAMACFADFDPSREDTVTLYSRRDWGNSLPASAPIITDIAFTFFPNYTEWKSMPPGENYIAETADNLQFIKITAMAESFLQYTQAGGVSFHVGVDNMPYAGQDVGHFVQVMDFWEGIGNISVIEDGKRYLMTSIYFYITNGLPQGEHFIDIVIYDWANNRTEQRIYLDVTNSSSMTTVDLSGSKPDWYNQRATTYGVSYNLYSKETADPIENALMSLPPDPVGPNGDTIRIYFDLNYLQQGYQGYELERSLNQNGPFQTAVRRVFINPPSRFNITVYDASAELVGGVTYYYRLRTFNNNGYSQYSDVSAITPLPSFNVNLAFPANQAVINTLRPTFKFRVTNDALLNPEMADFCDFTLYVRNKSGADILKTRFEVDFTDIDEEGNPTVWFEYPYGSYSFYAVAEDPFVWIEDNGIIVIDTSLASKIDIDDEAIELGYFEPGVGYEWNIFGQDASSDAGWNNSDGSAMFFQKTWSLRKTSQSFSTIMDEGSGATNGYFTFIMHPNAE
ncbi:MAG: hypothetical protein LBQ86_08195 [Holophagales bacterium]|jgi:hypothetical protein|nr:hypothetical protein [Holophagales bacterium]